MTADEAVKSRAPLGVSTHDMASGWLVIVGRREDQSRTWYFHVNDDPRLRDALLKIAHEYVEMEDRPHA